MTSDLGDASCICLDWCPDLCGVPMGDWEHVGPFGVLVVCSG